jgi:hypothetical protein
MGKYYFTMENLTDNQYSKFQVTIHFEMDEHFMALVPTHRLFVNKMIEKGIIDYYSVSMETQRCWIIFNAMSKNEIHTYLKQSSLHKYWTIEIDELFVYDAQSYRLPALQFN